MDSIKQYKQELQSKYDKLLTVKDRYDENLQRISDIHKQLPSDDFALLSELSTLEDVNDSYRDELSELPIIQRELEELQFEELPDRQRHKIYEQEKKKLKSKNLTPKEYEEEIKNIKLMLNI